MCVVSALGDSYADRWKWVPTAPPTPNVYQPPTGHLTVINGVSRAEFDALKAEVIEMKELMRAAKRIDEVTGQPDCDNDEKLAVLRKVAELVGIDLEDVFGVSS